jgi:hypothetical protein
VPPPLLLLLLLVVVVVCPLLLVHLPEVVCHQGRLQPTEQQLQQQH